MKVLVCGGRDFNDAMTLVRDTWARPQRRACDEQELKNALADVEYLCTALRRIRSLEEKNVPKYAQMIAREALAKLPDHPKGE